MLILLTGAEGIGKIHLARAIMSQMNTFEHEGRTIEFRHDFDGNANIYVDGKDYTNIDDINPLYTDIIQAADRIYDEIFSEYIKTCRCYDIHADLDYEIGISNEKAPVVDNGGMLNSVDVLEIYENRPQGLENVVITGTFGKSYLETIKNELGDEVHIINITRNPSAAWLFNYKPDDFFDSPTKPDLDRPLHIQKFVDSTIIAGLNTEVDFIETIKFENMIHDGLFINGQKIVLGKGYRPHNEYISKYEYENHNSDTLTQVNNAMSTFDPLWFNPNITSDYDSKTAVECINAAKTAVPNIFALYPDYEPLTYEQITSGSAQ